MRFGMTKITKTVFCVFFLCPYRIPILLIQAINLESICLIERLWTGSRDYTKSGYTVANSPLFSHSRRTGEYLNGYPSSYQIRRHLRFEDDTSRLCAFKMIFLCCKPLWAKLDTDCKNGHYVNSISNTRLREVLK